MNGSKAPDPMQSAMMQSAFNTQAAQQQQKMNMTNQITPYGSLTYSADPNSPSGYTANQSYSPEVAALNNSNIANAQGESNAQGGLLANANANIQQPLDLSYDANASRLADLQRKTLDPMWSERQNTFDQTMANRGLVPGSQAYNSASRDFGNERDNAYNSMFLNAYNTATNNAQAQYNSPFNALASLRSGSQVAQPVSSLGMTSTPQESVQAPNYMGAVQSQYAQNQQGQNATMGGLFGLGGTIGSAAMKYGLPLMMA